MRLPRVLLLALLFILVFSLPGWPARTVQGASQPVSTVQISPVGTCCNIVNDFFTINVMLILPSGESVNGFDVRINYTNAFTAGNPGVLEARTITYSNNLFAPYSSNILVECIDGTAVQGSSGCPSDDAPIGQFHLSELISAQAVVGPVRALLFSVTFTVTGLGTSIFTIDRANLVNPHPDPSNPQLINPVLIPVLKQDGIFGNRGIVSFFNYQPSDISVTPSIIPNQPVSFDASASFAGVNGSALGFRLYSWNFGDNTPVSNVTTSPTNVHIFRAAGNYSVSLTIWNTNNASGSVVRKVSVLPALGGLSLTVKDERGTVLRNVNVRLYNSSSFARPFITKPVGGGGDIQFGGLTPGDSYYLTFSGSTVENFSKTESVQPGLTTYDTVYMPLKQPPADYGGLIYLGTILGGLGIVTAAIVYRMRSRRDDSSPRSRRKVKNKN